MIPQILYFVKRKNLDFSCVLCYNSVTMPLKIYNTLTRKKEEFIPLAPPLVKMYVCGMTVQDRPHIGHMRAYVVSDTLKRWLTHRGFKIKHIQNITDIDDKIIEKTKTLGKDYREIAEGNAEEFMRCSDIMGIERADFYPKATQHVQEIIELILKLIQKGYAYTTDTGVYFDISRFPDYGKLSGKCIDDLKKGARVEIDDTKHSPLDFVLWKRAKEGEPFWESPWGRGRPGWHIECSAMSLTHLGETIDIHTGGEDLIFPHHENEIAQSEAATDRQFARFFLHNEHLLSDNEKMSKSLGNFYTLRDLISRGFDPLSFRYLCLQAHYRSKMNFSFASLRAAENALGEIRKLGQRQSNSRTHPFIRLSDNPIIKALEDDLDTPKALSILHQENDFRLWEYFEPVLGFGLLGIRNKEIGIRGEVKDLINKRQQLRKAGKFGEADKIRKEIESKGYEIEDTEKGPRILKT